MCGFEGKNGAGASEKALEMCANIDDMTAEDLSAAMDVLLGAGALDVWFEHLQMKKNRPAVKLSLLARPEEKGRMAELMLRHKTTLGVRKREVERATLERRVKNVETRFGPVRFKEGLLGGRVIKSMPEFDDIKKISRETGLPTGEIRKGAEEDEKSQRADAAPPPAGV